ncbi:VOC family protein [Pimelobacter simplex]|uniref:VOC family protein n=1 Tax=Nocardioides simplex TaxID=2045 RepID=UPI00137609AC|nr:VOC family protein [Pimelobacter simplex]
MFRRIDHVGVVVDDLVHAGAVLRLLGFSLIRAQEVPERGVSIAFYGCGDGQIELIEPLRADIRGARLGSGAIARIEHIGVEVDSVHAVADALQALGVALTHADPVQIGPNLSNWTKIATTAGIQFQLVERRDPGSSETSEATF